MPSTNSGFIIQSTHGTRGNFELVVASPMGGLAHCWRNNDAPGYPWIGSNFFGSGEVVGVSLIQSNYGTPGLGHLEVIVRVGDRLAHYFREDQPPFRWFGPFYLASGVSGVPALIQSRFGAKGNFEVVVPLASGGLAHYWRNNDDPAQPWIEPTIFGHLYRSYDAVALIQSNFDSPGNLEVIATAVSGSPHQLEHYWRDSGPEFNWHGPTVLQMPGIGDATIWGVPGFIQSRHGTKGNFEVVVGVTDGGMVHLWRNNDVPSLPWSAPTRFGSGNVTAVSLIQSNFGTPGLGNLEVVARTGNRTAHYWRQDQSPFAWSGPTAFACDEPTCNPVTQGEWRIPYSSGVVGIHSALLYTGKVLFFSYKEHENQKLGDSSVLDPVNDTLTRPSMMYPFADKNLFCAGLAFLPDGRLLVAGGNSTGVRSLHTFTPHGADGTWQYLRDMSDDRWYPTCTTLPDGRVFIISGTKNGGGPQPGAPVNDTYEIFDPVSGLQPPRSAAFLNSLAPYSLYAFVFVLPLGKLLIHVNNQTRFLDLSTWDFDSTVLTTVSSAPRTYNLEGTCVLLPLLPTTTPPYRAQVMLIGGGGLPPAQSTPATNTCEILDLSATPLVWRSAPSMSQPRVMPDAVLLPDGTVLVMNGSRTGKADDGTNPVFEAEQYNPTTNTWATLCSMRVPRLYHSTALLLPDGRVLTAGKDEEFNPEPFKYPEYRIEVFSPPYLFRGARPHITVAPTDITYGTTFDVETPDGASVASVALIRAGAVTHSFNMEQRYVGLVITARPTGRLTLQAPPNGNVAPPGYYMLFLVTSAGVPSIAQFVRLH